MLKRVILDKTLRRSFFKLKTIVYIGSFLDYLVWWLITGSLLGGVFILLAKRAFPALGKGIFLLSFLPLLSVPGALVFSFLRRKSESFFVGLADKLWAGKGLLLAVWETGDKRWASRLSQRVRPHNLPRLGLPKGTFFCAVSLAFFLSTLFVPQKEEDVSSIYPLQRNLKRIARKQAEIVREIPLQEKMKKEALDTLQALQKEFAKGSDKSSMDSLDQTAKKIAQELLERKDRLERLSKRLKSILERAEEYLQKERRSGGILSKTTSDGFLRSIKDSLNKCAIDLSQKLGTKSKEGLFIDTKGKSLESRLMKQLLERAKSCKSSEELCRSLREAARLCEEELKSLQRCEASLRSLCREMYSLGCGRESMEVFLEAGKARPLYENTFGIDEGPGKASKIFGKESPEVSLQPKAVLPKALFPSEKSVTFKREVEPPDSKPKSEQRESLILKEHGRSSFWDEGELGIPPSRIKTVKRYFGGMKSRGGSSE